MTSMDRQQANQMADAMRQQGQPQQQQPPPESLPPVPTVVLTLGVMSDGSDSVSLMWRTRNGDGGADVLAADGEFEFTPRVVSDRVAELLGKLGYGPMPEG